MKKSGIVILAAALIMGCKDENRNNGEGSNPNSPSVDSPHSQAAYSAMELMANGLSHDLGGFNDFGLIVAERSSYSWRTHLFTDSDQPVVTWEGSVSHVSEVSGLIDGNRLLLSRFNTLNTDKVYNQDGDLMFQLEEPTGVGLVFSQRPETIADSGLIGGHINSLDRATVWNKDGSYLDFIHGEIETQLGGEYLDQSTITRSAFMKREAAIANPLNDQPVPAEEFEVGLTAFGGHIDSGSANCSFDCRRSAFVVEYADDELIHVTVLENPAEKTEAATIKVRGLHYTESGDLLALIIYFVTDESRFATGIVNVRTGEQLRIQAEGEQFAWDNAVAIGDEENGKLRVLMVNGDYRFATIDIENMSVLSIEYARDLAPSIAANGSPWLTYNDRFEFYQNCVAIMYSHDLHDKRTYKVCRN